MVAVYRYDEQTAGQVGHCQMYDEKSDRLIVAKLVFVYDYDKQVADNADEADYRMLQNDDPLENRGHFNV